MRKKIRYTILLFFIFSVSFAQKNEVLHTPFSFNFKNISVDSALNIIEKSIDFFFIYDAKLVENKSLVTAKFNYYPLSVIIDSLFNNPILDYKVLEKQIVIYRNVTSKIAAVTEVIPKKLKTIRGLVLDSTDNSTLPFSTISIFNKGVGTISNLDGEFNFKINEDYFADTLVISHLGYEPLLLRISEIDTNRTFKLKTKTISLQEILIRWSDPKELLISALNAARNNYPDNPTQLRAFYRESLQRNKKYMLYTEGLLDVYKSAYRPTIFKDQAKLLQLRKFTNIELNDTILIKLQGGIETSINLDLIRHPLNFVSLNEIDLYDYFYEGIENLNSTNTHKIRFEPNIYNPSKDYMGSIYIDVESLAIVGVQFSLTKQSAKKSAKNIVLSSKPGIKVIPKSIKYNISYKKIDNKFYINHISGDMNLKVKLKRKLLASNYRIHFEMITTDITTTNIQKFKRKEKVKSHQILSDVRYSYLENLNQYWGVDNFIVPESNLLKALNKFKVEELSYQVYDDPSD